MFSFGVFSNCLCLPLGVQNLNTISCFQFQLTIYEYSTDMKGASVQVLGIEKGNGTTLTKTHNKTLINTIPVSEIAVQITQFLG